MPAPSAGEPNSNTVTPADWTTCLDPSHVAVFGASASPAKWGYNAPEKLLDGGYEGRLTLVNPRGGTALGRPLVSAEEATGADLAVVATPASAVPQVLRQCGELGIPTAVVAGGGFREVGNHELDAELMVAIAESGVRVIGPNCVGIYVGPAHLNVTTIPYLRPGNVSCISQSGGVVQQVSTRLSHLGSGYDICLAFGNKADVGFTEALSAVSSRETTSGVLLYLERFDEGDALLEAVEAAAQQVTVTCLLGGRTETGRRAALSHTGSIAGSWERTAGMLRDAGAYVTDKIEHAAAAASGGRRGSKPHAQRVFLLYDGGGHSVLLSDALTSQGYEIPPPSPELVTAGLTSNPFDFGAVDPREVLAEFPPKLDTLLQDDQYDAVILGAQLAGGYEAIVHEELAAVELEVVERMATAAGASEKTVVLQTLHASEPNAAKDAGRALGLAIVEFPSEVVDVLNARTRRREAATAGNGPEPRENIDSDLLARLDETLAVFARRGIPQALGDVIDASQLPADGNQQWVLRLDGFLHKAESGAIRLPLSVEELEGAYQDLEKLAIASGLEPRIRLAPFIPHQHELIISFWRSKTAGNGWMVGRGGGSVEHDPDVFLGRVPKSADDVRRALSHSSLGRKLIAEATNLPAITDTALSIAAAFFEELSFSEMECNPIGLVDGNAVIFDVLPSR